MAHKYHKQEVDFNLYVILKVLESILNYLPISKNYYSRIYKLTNDLINDLFSYPKELKSLDITDLKYEITTYFEEFIPNNKGGNHANI